MSVTKLIYTDLKAILDTLKTAGTINHVAVWNSQTENETKEDAFNFPAVFIDFSEITWDRTQQIGIQTNTKVTQSGTITFTLHIAFHTLYDETDYFPTALDTIFAIYNAVNGMSGGYYSPFYRSGERQDVSHDNVQVWEIDYTSINVTECPEADELVDATDGGASPVSITITKDLDIDNYVIRTGDGVE